MKKKESNNQADNCYGLGVTEHYCLRCFCFDSVFLLNRYFYRSVPRQKAISIVAPILLLFLFSPYFFPSFNDFSIIFLSFDDQWSEFEVKVWGATKNIYIFNELMIMNNW